MSGIKNLAGQTIWYGVSSIAARFINYLLTPYLTLQLSKADYGKVGLVYAAIPLLNVLFTYGFETAYFRFSQNSKNPSLTYSTASISLIISTIVFGIALWFNHGALTRFAGLEDVPILINLSILVIVMDTLTTLPFAKLRLDNKPQKFAFIRILSILVNIAATVFFISYCPQILAKNPGSWITFFYSSGVNPVVYIVLANVIQSAITLLLLLGEIGSVKIAFDKKLWWAMMLYSLPLVVAGMGGMINETFDRIMLRWWVPGTVTYKEEQVGVYNACYKLAILISLFIQAFKMAAEPFFFKQAEGQNAQRTYARVMKFFVITVAFMFLVVALFLPVWRYFIAPKHWEGLKVVPILLLANIFLGIYYNLSIWYKLGNRTMAGAYITLFGACITLLINWLFIPRYGFMACAWATLLCYATMMVTSFIWGQREYRIPYAWKKLLAYIAVVVLLYLVHAGITTLLPNLYFHLILAALFLGAFGWLVVMAEKSELKKLPVFSRLLK